MLDPWCDKLAAERDIRPVKAALAAVRGNLVTNIQSPMYKVHLTLQDYKKMFSSYRRDCFCTSLPQSVCIGYLNIGSAV